MLVSRGTGRRGLIAVRQGTMSSLLPMQDSFTCEYITLSFSSLPSSPASSTQSTGEPDRPPVKIGVAMTDLTTGLYVHGAVMAALIGRSKTGKGVHIDASLFESQIASLANIASNYLVAGQEAGRHGTSHPSIVPYQV